MFKPSGNDDKKLFTKLNSREFLNLFSLYPSVPNKIFSLIEPSIKKVSWEIRDIKF